MDLEDKEELDMPEEELDEVELPETEADFETLDPDALLVDDELDDPLDEEEEVIPGIGLGIVEEEEEDEEDDESVDFDLFDDIDE